MSDRKALEEMSTEDILELYFIVLAVPSYSMRWVVETEMLRRLKWKPEEFKEGLN